MRRILLLGIVVLFGLVPAARADFIYQGRFITLRIATGNKPAAMPPASVLPPPTSNKSAVVPPPGLPLEVAPPNETVPAVGKTPVRSVATITTKPVTLQQFTNYRPTSAGNYRATFVHPDTGSPVTVDFTLPNGRPQVSAGKRLITFDYGKEEVEIRFDRSGEAQVTYRR